MASAQYLLHMKPEDLIKREPLDGGGFGDVYLCYHVTLGQVVLKTVYTGTLRNDESKRSLLEEGSIMASLNHERVVKLLGVIMEDKDCSLVMELIPRGNLLVMLETVSVPVSIKGRIILEILEGMVYLTEKRILHKDIKPGNILVDKDFHIKIADLGLATYQTWSKLTKEESRRKSHAGRSAGARGAGTLSYMAPEHLESIHALSTEKSDVYSFAIVVWVILTGEEPYANARNEDQISQCVRKGDRPAENLIPEDTPAEIIELMKTCWNHNPQQRPTFKEAYDFFFPLYTEKLEPRVKKDLAALQDSYEGPDDLVEKMKSLSVAPECCSVDCPAPLLSSENASVPVEASIEDMHDIYTPSLDSIQTDANVQNPCDLDEKLSQELKYHIHGNYNNQADAAPCYRRSISNPFLQNHASGSEHSIRQPEENASSVQSWTKAEPVQPFSQEEPWCRPGTVGPVPSHLPMSTSNPSLSHFTMQNPHSQYDRQQSCPHPVPDTFAPDKISSRVFNSYNSGSNDPGSLYIQNASGIQIGNKNTMIIRGHEHPNSLSASARGSATSHLKERIQKYEDHAVTEDHLNIVSVKIGTKWKRCARYLGLTSVDIETIMHDYSRDGLPEMVYQMLELWKMKEGSIGCRVGKLCEALLGNVEVDVIQNILDTCAASPLIS